MVCKYLLGFDNVVQRILNRKNNAPQFLANENKFQMFSFFKDLYIAYP